MTKYGRVRQTTYDSMRIARWITKATYTHSEYLILKTFLRQEWLHGRASVLRCTYIACLIFVRGWWFFFLKILRLTVWPSNDNVLN